MKMLWMKKTGMKNEGIKNQGIKNKEGRQYLLINICFVLALCIVAAPLLILSAYNFPSADDWSYGRDAYKALQAGGGVGTVLRISFETVARYYVGWEGRFMNAFFASLQPGIWGEEYYAVVAWLMLGGLILGELFLFHELFGRLLCREGRENRGLWFPVAAATLILQILYTPSAVESFYWYTGAVNYTFVFGLSMILTALFLKLGLGNTKGWKYGLTAAAACVLSVAVGGDNYSTSLSTFLFMLCSYALLPVFCGQAAASGKWFDRAVFGRLLRRTWYLVVLTGGSLLACILAPGNAKRLEGNFGGATTGNALVAVLQSLWRSFTNIWSWTDVKILLMVLVILPFVWLAVKNMRYEFRFPGIFTLFTFGLYASQITSNLYVDGTTGGGRVAAILYYSYHVWLVGNVWYWTGWLCRRRQSWPAFLERVFSAAGPFVRRFLIPYCAVAGIILAGVIYTFDLKEISSYRAYRDWRQGWAQQYAAEWRERLEVLHDETVTQVEFAPLSVYPETMLYTDLQDQDGYIWVNKACANYYGKEYIHVVNVTE